MDRKRIASIAFFIGWSALAWYNPNIAILVVGIPLLVFDLVAIARRRIRVRGKVGTYRTYTGLEAVFFGLFFGILTATLCLFAVHDLWPSLVPW